MLVHCSLLRSVVIGEVGLLMLSWWCLYCYYKKCITIAGLFFFIILFSYVHL
jgi:hypothetical protein